MSRATHIVLQRDPRNVQFYTGGRDLLFANTTGQNAGKGAAVGGTVGSAIPVIGTAVGTAVGAAIGALVNPTKKLIKNIRKDSDKLFLADRNDVDDMLAAAGYLRPDRGGRSDAPSFTEFKIKDEQVSGKADRYDYAYERLQKFLVKMFNTYSPGLGDLYAPENPVYMRSANNVAHEWIEYIDAFIKTYPAGSAQARLLVQSRTEQTVKELEAQGATDAEIEAITGVDVTAKKVTQASIPVAIGIIILLIIIGAKLVR